MCEVEVEVTDPLDVYGDDPSTDREAGVVTSGGEHYVTCREGANQRGPLNEWRLLIGQLEETN